MTKSLLFTIVLSLVVPILGEASSMFECKYNFRIESMSNSGVTVKVLKRLDASVGFCPKYISGSHRIKKDKMFEGKNILAVGVVVQARRHSYSAMTPSGAVSFINWKFKKMKP